MEEENLKMPQAGYLRRRMEGLVPLCRAVEKPYQGAAGSGVLPMSKHDDFKVEEVLWKRYSEKDDLKSPSRHCAMWGDS